MLKLVLLPLLAACIAAQETHAPVPSLVCSPLEPNVVYTGYNLINTTRATADECCDDCRDTPGCTIFVFYKNSCRLKTNAGPVRTVDGAVSSFLVPETPEPTPEEPRDEPTPSPVTCGCVGGSLCSDDGYCGACSMMWTAGGGRTCEDRLETTCRWYGQRWCGDVNEDPEPPANPVGRCECHAGHMCDLERSSCGHCNYPRLAAGPGMEGVCEDWERGACLHTFGGQWCGGMR
ncbi:hypothetical protein DYB25_007004 [Aphanomyces astaci]|uniref:Apple domain-containing protein n=1 Tax=Aphanomyces astaci TaxID=112090 RepID=A0A397BP25_APHAT|nr:hypothetical protein DYB25_007004 [Aphanomyces astaci]